MGVVGLISVPMLVTAVVWLVAICLTVERSERGRTFAVITGSAAAVFLLWAGPVIASYLRFGGFVDITPLLGVEWSLPTALASWGILLPIAIAGLILVITTQPPVIARPLLAYIAGSCVLLALAIARSRFDWGVFANETLLHQGRIWPPLHLLGAALAGIAVVSGYGWLRARSRPIAVTAIAITLAVGAVSPVVAARGLTDILDRDLKGFTYDRADIDANSFLRRAAPEVGPDDVIRVEGSDELAFLMFQLSGVRLATYDDPRLVGNDLRIRFADLARQWDARMASDGFDADLVVRRSDVRVAGQVAGGRFHGEEWVMVPDG
jgi:hypothetical protein